MSLAQLRASIGLAFPQSLFANGEKGFIFDFSDPFTQFQLSSGSTLVTATGDPIGYIRDLSPNGKNATQATTTKRPVRLGMARTLGSELAGNGRFSDGSVWTLGTGWSIAASAATKVAGSASNMTQPISFTAGTAYYVFYNMTRTAGTLNVQLTGGTTPIGGHGPRSTSGSYCEIFVAQSGNTTLSFTADSAFAGTVYSVSVKAITGFTNIGAYFDGVDDKLATAAIDFSGVHLLTYGLSVFHGQDITTQRYIEIGNFSASTAGSNMLQGGPNPRAFLRGASTSADQSLPAVEAGGVSSFMGQANVSVQVDTSQATIATELKVRNRGVQPTNTAAGTLATGNLVNGVVSIGAGTTASSFTQGIQQRVLGIGRTLTSTELAAYEAWQKAGMVNAAILGDSTTAILNSAGGFPDARNTSTFCGGLVCGGADIAHSGDRIANQKTAWTAIAQKTALEVVIVQIGLNDVKGRVGAGSATTAQVITDYQDLINTIRTDAPAACKIYVSQLTPCKAWLDLATFPAAAYTAWLDVNTAIAGGGSTPITGVDGRITAHVAPLNNGSGYLNTIYDFNNDGVHLNNEGRFINAITGWRASLEADGLLSP